MWQGLVLLVPAGAVFGLGVAWAAVWAQQYFAPLVVFPLLIGAALGVAIVLTMRTAQMGNRPTIVAAAVAAAVTAVGGQHYLAFRAEHRLAEEQARQIQQEASATFGSRLNQYIPEPPENVFVFLQNHARTGRELNMFGWVARDWVAWLSWAVDGVLVLVATLAVVVPVTFLPYCNRCRSWYRETRSGRIEGHTARRLVESLGESATAKGLSVRCRLLGCRGGCGPTACVLVCHPPGTRPKTARGWLDTTGRDQIIQILDHAAKS